MAKKRVDNTVGDKIVPLWLKCTGMIFLLGAILVLYRSLFGIQKATYDISPAILIIVSAVLVFLAGFAQIVIIFFPKGKLSFSLYWLLRFFKKPICAFSLLGLIFLLPIPGSLSTLRGAGSLLMLFSLFLAGCFTKPIDPHQSPFPVTGWLSNIVRKITQKTDLIPRWILCLFIAVLPALIAWGVIYFGLHARLSDYRPYSLWNDEVSYWIWIRSFSQAGLTSGYNAPNELIAKAAFNHYGEGSPLYIFFYGSIAQLVGWSSELPLIINFIILALAIFAFTRVARLDSLQIIFTGLVIILTWPVLMHLLTTSHESLNQAVGIILAGIFFVFLNKENKVGWAIKLMFIILVYLSTLIRISWGILLIPVLFYSLRGTVLSRSLFSVILGLGLFMSAYFITAYLVPPINNSIFQSVSNSFTNGPQALLIRFRDQFKTLFESGQINSNIAILIQVFVIVGWEMVRLARRIQIKDPLPSILQSSTVFNIYSLVMLVLAGFLFYIPAAFWRIFVPPLLVIYLLQVAKKDFKILGTLMVLNLVFFSFYLNHRGTHEMQWATQVITTDFTAEFPQRFELEEKLAKLVVYEPEAENSWCNTLLVPSRLYDYRLTTVPAGIGISYITYPSDSPGVQFPLKSNYLLLDADKYQEYADRLHVELIESLPIGDLYHNEDSDCTFNK